MTASIAPATVRKVLVDSRHGVGPSNNFTYELPESVETGPNCCFWVSDVSIFVSWPTIGSHNNRVYLVEKLDGETEYLFRIVCVAEASTLLQCSRKPWRWP